MRTNWGKSAKICPFGAGSGYLLYPILYNGSVNGSSIFHKLTVETPGRKEYNRAKDVNDYEKNKLFPPRIGNLRGGGAVPDQLDDRQPDHWGGAPKGL